MRKPSKSYARHTFTVGGLLLSTLAILVYINFRTGFLTFDYQAPQGQEKVATSVLNKSVKSQLCSDLLRHLVIYLEGQKFNIGYSETPVSYSGLREGLKLERFENGRIIWKSDDDWNILIPNIA